MATVLIENTPSTNTYRNLPSRHQVQTSDGHIYNFYELDGTGFGYKKSTDGGDSFTAFVTISTDETNPLNFDIYYERWDAQNEKARNIVHLLWTKSTATAGIQYNQLDLDTDLLGTIVQVATATVDSTGSGMSLAVSPARRLHIVGWPSTTTGGVHYMSRNDGADWISLTTPNEAVDDNVQLWPDWHNPDDDIRGVLAIYFDATASQMSGKRWNPVLDTWTEAALASWTHWGSDGPINMASALAADGTVKAIVTSDSTPTAVEAFTFTSQGATVRTDVLGSTALVGSVAITVDQGGRIWAFYGRDPLNADAQDRRVHYKYSDDDMVTWSTEFEYSTRDSEITWISADPRPFSRNLRPAFYEVSLSGSATADLRGEDFGIAVLLPGLSEYEKELRIATTVDKRLWTESLIYDFGINLAVNKRTINAHYFMTNYPQPQVSTDGMLVRDYGAPPFEFITTRLGTVPRDPNLPFRLEVNATFPQTGAGFGYTQQIVFGTLDGTEGKENDIRVVYRGDGTDEGDVEFIAPDGTIAFGPTANTDVTHEWAVEWRPDGVAGETGNEQLTLIRDGVIEFETTGAPGDDPGATSDEDVIVKPAFITVGTPQIPNASVTPLGTPAVPADMIQLEDIQVTPLGGGFEHQTWPAWTYSQGTVGLHIDNAKQSERFLLDGHTWAIVPTAQIVSASWKGGRNQLGDTFTITLAGAAGIDDPDSINTASLTLKDSDTTASSQERAGAVWHPSGLWICAMNSNAGEGFLAYPWDPTTESLGTRVDTTPAADGPIDFSPAGGFVVIQENIGADFLVHSFDGVAGTLNSPATDSTTIPGQGLGNSVHWHPGGNYIAGAGNSATNPWFVFPWDRSTATLGTIHTPAIHVTTPVGRGVSWSPDGEYLAVCYEHDGTDPQVSVYKFDKETGLLGQPLC